MRILCVIVATCHPQRIQWNNIIVSSPAVGWINVWWRHDKSTIHFHFHFHKPMILAACQCTYTHFIMLAFNKWKCASTFFFFFFFHLLFSLRGSEGHKWFNQSVSESTATQIHWHCERNCNKMMSTCHKDSDSNFLNKKMCYAQFLMMWWLRSVFIAWLGTLI